MAREVSCIFFRPHVCNHVFFAPLSPRAHETLVLSSPAQNCVAIEALPALAGPCGFFRYEFWRQKPLLAGTAVDDQDSCSDACGCMRLPALIILLL